jgi:hypothetical protein
MCGTSASGAASDPLRRAEADHVRARANGRPPALTPHQRSEALQRLREGATQADLARTNGVSQATISRLEPRPFVQVGVANHAGAALSFRWAWPIPPARRSNNSRPMTGSGLSGSSRVTLGGSSGRASWRGQALSHEQGAVPYRPRETVRRLSRWASDVLRYFKNERFGFSVTYYEGNRPRQYYPGFIVVTRTNGSEVAWLAETKGEMRPNTALKSEAARGWCEKMSRTSYGRWEFLFVPQRKFEAALAAGVPSVSQLSKQLRENESSRGTTMFASAAAEPEAG